MPQAASDVRAAKAGHIAAGADGLSVVLDDEQVVLLGDAHQGLVPAGRAIQVYRHHRTGARGYQALNQPGVQVHGVLARVAQHGFQIAVAHGENAGNIGVGWDNDFVTVVQQPHFFVGSQDESQRVEPVAHGHAVFHLAQRSDFLFQQVCFGAVQVASSFDDLACRSLELIHIGRIG